MHAVFNLMVVNTLIFSVLFGCILLLKAIFKKRLSATVQYVLWLVVVVKLLIPVSFTMQWSPYALFKNAQLSTAMHTSDYNANRAPVVDTQLPAIGTLSSGNASYPVETDYNVNSTTDSKPATTVHSADTDWMALAVYVWITGIACYAAWLGFRSLLLKKKIICRSTSQAPQWIKEEFQRCKSRLDIKKDIRVVLQGFFPVPAIMGILKPVLIVPDKLARGNGSEKIQHVFIHELMHYKRKDIWAIWVLNILNAVYWFNPLIWLCIRLIHQDMEMACDSMVVQTLGTDNRHGYIQTILYFSGKQGNVRMHAAMSLNDGCTRMQKRIQGMFLIKKTKHSVKTAIAALASLMVFVGFTAGCQSSPGKGIGANNPVNLKTAVNSSLGKMVSGIDGKASVSSAETGKAVIEIPSYYDSESLYSNLLGRMNGWLEKADQNVEIKVRQGMNMKDSIRMETSAGAFSATAYALSLTDSKELFYDKITMDMTDLIRQNAKAYYSKYSNLFPVRLGGVPVAIYERPLWLKPVLMLRQEYEQASGGIESINGFFKFVDTTIAPTGGKEIVIAEPYYLINEWALEQGYYNLDVFNIRGYLYAAIDDAQCAPVALESIPGFMSFLNQLCAYYKSGALINKPNMVDGTQVAGYVTSLHVYFAPHPYSPLNWMPWIEGKFTAHEFSPDLPAHMVGPFYNMELAVPAASSAENAIDVIRFVEWLYTSQDNYNAVLYGEKGVDFRDENGKFTPLVEGKTVEMISTDQPSKFFFTWPGSNVLCNSDFFRVPSVAPAKVEELVDNGIKRNLRFPLYTYMNAFNIDNNVKLNTPEDIMGISDQRQQLVDNFLYSIPNTLANRTDDEIKALFDGLSTCKNAQLVESYTGLIKKLYRQSKDRLTGESGVLSQY